jgi:hypothetical protein
VRSSIATLKPIEQLEVSLEAKTARLRFDKDKAPLQELTRRVYESSESHNFTARVAFVLTGAGDATKNAVAAIKKVEGVTAVTGPDKDGRIEIDLDNKKKTMCAAIVKAAKDAGATIADVPKPKTDEQ